jgi:phasin family protein
MADPRPDAKTVTQNGQEAVRKAADEGVRVTRASAEAGERSARASAEAMQRNAKTVEDAWRSGSDLAMRITEQSADQFSRIFGLSGEEAQRAAQTSSRNLHALLQSSTLLAETAQNISREWFEFARARLEHNLSQIEALLRARTPQDLAALQSELLRDNLEGWLQSTRRIAELSARMSDEAARKIGDTVEQARRAA